MCLIVFSYRQHPDFPLILAANRDEFHARPADAMGWWPDDQPVVGGRDLKAGGSWLAVSRSGRLAAVTNVREANASIAERSRGEIVSQFVNGEQSTKDFSVALSGRRYAGFNALLGQPDALTFTSNRPGDDGASLASGVTLPAGIFGISNSSLDTPWEKTLNGKAALSALINNRKVTVDELFEVLADREPATDSQASSAGLPASIARAASAPFIVTPDYGTRCTTAILWRADGHIEIAERRFDTDGELSGESRFVFLVARR